MRRGREGGMGREGRGVGKEVREGGWWEKEVRWEERGNQENMHVHVCSQLGNEVSGRLMSELGH